MESSSKYIDLRNIKGDEGIDLISFNNPCLNFLAAVGLSFAINLIYLSNLTTNVSLYMTFINKIK